MRIRRSACGALVVTCSVAASAAALAAETKRTAEAPYETPGGVAGVIAGDTVINGESYGGATFETRRSERAVSVSLADGTGMPAAGELAQDVDGDGVLEQPFASFCGRTSEPVPITRWDYTKPDLVDATVALGERDAERYAPLVEELLAI